MAMTLDEIQEAHERDHGYTRNCPDCKLMAKGAGFQTDARDLILHDIRGYAQDVADGKLEPDWPRIVRMVDEAYRVSRE